METDGEVMLEGLSAWMRGWRDVEEGFQVRARARQVRRDRKQEQLLQLGEKGKLGPQRGMTLVETSHRSTVA